MDGFLSGHDHDIRMSFIHPVELQVRPPRKDMDERGRSCSAGMSKFTADPRVLGHKTRLTKFSKTDSDSSRWEVKFHHRKVGMVLSGLIMTAQDFPSIVPETARETAHSSHRLLES